MARKRIMLAGAGETCILSLAVLRSQAEDAYLRKLLKTVRVMVDWKRRKKRYLAHYPDPAAPQEQMYEAALAMGYPPEHVFKQVHDKDFWLKLISKERVDPDVEPAKIDAIVVVSYGHAIEPEILKAVNGNCFVLHPCRALPIDAKYIPMRDRGAGVIENVVASGEDRAPMQIAMFRAEEVKDPSDPCSWDAGRIVARSSVFPGPTFQPEERGPENLSRRVVVTQRWIAPMYAQPLHQLPRILGYKPEDLVEARVPKSRIRQLFGYTPEELRDAGLLKK